MNPYEREYLAWYHRDTHPGTRFDPRTLVECAQAQWTDEPQLAVAFARCTRAWDRNELYTYFNSPADRRTKHFAANLFLAHPTLGALVVDVMTDGSIGGIEYLDRVMGHPMDIGELRMWMLRSVCRDVGGLRCN
ncbi:MAG: hypothetical protein IPI81_16180 [Flavobacteriales bacterium]|nr:hypothetical protein [Flavobacteriales bacterium]